MRHRICDDCGTIFEPESRLDTQCPCCVALMFDEPTQIDDFYFSMFIDEDSDSDAMPPDSDDD